MKAQRAILPLLLLTFVGCRAKYRTTAPTRYDPYPVYLGQPLAIGGEPLAFSKTGGAYRREAYFGSLGGAGTQRTGPTEETVTTASERTAATSGQGHARGRQFVANARIYCGRYWCAPGMIIIPVIYGKVYAGAEGEVVNLVGKQ